LAGATFVLMMKAKKETPMRYMYLVKSCHQGMPPQRLFEEMDKLQAKAVKSGAMIDSGGLMPPQMGSAHIKLEKGKVTVTDMPLAEGKEVIGGYAIFEFKTREEAIASALEFMNLHKEFGEGWEGVCEMRPMAVNPHSAPRG
jgi:hypothetical protein